MVEYLIKKGADCKVAIDPRGYAKQEADISLTIEFYKLSNGQALSPKRLSHLKTLLTAMRSIPDDELPKTINIPD